MSGTKTTVEVTNTTWKRLNKRKEPGESFNEIINRLLEKDEECNHGE